MKAILVTYCCDQNEPSKPIAKLYDVPSKTAQRNSELKALFREYVCEDYEDDRLKINTRKVGYGDLSVSDSYGDLFLFVTYVKD